MARQFHKKHFRLWSQCKVSLILKNCTCLSYQSLTSVCVLQALITQTRAKQAATMSEVQWRGRTVPVKIDKVRIFLLGLADNEEAIAQVTKKSLHLLCQYFNSPASV